MAEQMFSLKDSKIKFSHAALSTVHIQKVTTDVWRLESFYHLTVHIIITETLWSLTKVYANVYICLQNKSNVVFMLSQKNCFYMSLLIIVYLVLYSSPAQMSARVELWPPCILVGAVSCCWPLLELKDWWKPITWISEFPEMYNNRLASYLSNVSMQIQPPDVLQSDCFYNAIYC